MAASATDGAGEREQDTVTLALVRLGGDLTGGWLSEYFHVVDFMVVLSSAGELGRLSVIHAIYVTDSVVRREAGADYQGWPRALYRVAVGVGLWHLGWL
jgi:hypothetical protein